MALVRMALMHGFGVDGVEVNGVGAYGVAWGNGHSPPFLIHHTSQSGVVLHELCWVH